MLRCATLSAIRNRLAGLSQADLAGKLGTSPRRVSRLESEPQDAKVSDLQEYARALEGELSVVVTLAGGQKRRVILFGNEPEPCVSELVIKRGAPIGYGPGAADRCPDPIRLIGTPTRQKKWRHHGNYTPDR